MLLGLITLLTAFALSSAAIYFSVVGLVAIFSGAAGPIIFMGTTLELAKLVTASWLYRNWHVAARYMKVYLTISIFILMVITSMGVFGFLSKSHLQQGATSSNNTQQISIINSQIKTEQDVIDRQQDIIRRNSGTGGGAGERVSQLRDKIKQLDAEVKAYTDQGATSTIFNDKVAKGVALKESQKAERDRIDAEIKQLTTANQGNNSAAEAQIARSQQKIQQLISQRAPLQTTQITLDAEIGPIKYIGELFVDLGMVDKVNTDMAVRWIIVLIIIVFDPLAVLLLIAGQQSIKQHYSNNGNGGGRSTAPIIDPTPIINRLSEKFKNFSFKKKDSSLDKLPTLSEPIVEPTVVQEQPAKPGLRLSTLSLPKSFTFKKTETVVPTEILTSTVEVIDTEDGDTLEIVTKEQKTRLDHFNSQKDKAKQWKGQQTNPRHTIKRLRFNYVSGAIDKLPWDTVEADIPPMPIDQWNQMLEEAEKALEQDKEQTTKSYIIKEDQQQVRKTVAEEYVQNQEQTDQSIWNRIKK
jgi:hypothetical protein